MNINRSMIRSRRPKRNSMIFICLMITSFVYVWINELNVLEEYQDMQLQNDMDPTTVSPEIVIITILCDHIPKPGKRTKLQQEMEVLMKSAVMLSSAKIRFIITSDSFETFELSTNFTASWSDKYKNKIKFEYREIVFPEAAEHLKSFGNKKCGTERLLFPDLFPDLDAAIYLDADVTFMRRPDDLWAELKNFNDKQVAGVSPCLNLYGYDKSHKTPYPGKSGLNSGVMLMNLTRMRSLQDGGWSNAVLEVFDKYQGLITLGDQGILNAVFHDYEENLYELGCEWNFRYYSCRNKINVCTKANETGVALLHGVTGTFTHGSQEIFKTIFRTWDNYQMGSSLTDLLFQLKDNIKNTNKTGWCDYIADAEKVFTKSLQIHLESLLRKSVNLP